MNFISKYVELIFDTNSKHNLKWCTQDWLGRVMDKEKVSVMNWTIDHKAVANDGGGDNTILVEVSMLSLLLAPARFFHIHFCRSCFLLAV